MKVFFVNDVPGVGIEGEVRVVSDGYAKNFLFPRFLAIDYEGNKKIIDEKIFSMKEKKEKVVQKRSKLYDDLDGKLLIFERPESSSSGMMTGWIGVNDIIEKLIESGITLSKRQIDLSKSIKTFGLHHVKVFLSSSLAPTIKIKILKTV